jgi:hypothetical protein
LGVAFLPRMCVENELTARELRMVPVEEMHMERKVRLVYPVAAAVVARGAGVLEMMGETDGLEQRAQVVDDLRAHPVGRATYLARRGRRVDQVDLGVHVRAVRGWRRPSRGRARSGR